jgi:hypothetical protein
MATAINGRKIQKVCTIHGIQYGKRGIPDPNIPVIENGICDICEEIGTKNAPQAVRPVEAYINIRVIKGVTTKYSEPKNP